MKWKPVNRTWAEYKESVPYEQRAGRAIRLASTVKFRKPGDVIGDDAVLIGNINAQGGFCDDCAIHNDDNVLEELDLSELIGVALRGATS